MAVPGKSPAAEEEGVDALLPMLERRRGGEAGVKTLLFLKGEALWQAARDQLWSWSLLTAALSRSDSPQGDPVRDGRTQDLAALGLVPKLATDPRGWVMEHSDGLRSSVLLLEGVVGDANFALRPSGSDIISAQLYRPPKPGQHEFSRLAAVVEDFFVSGMPPWKIQRSLLAAGLREAFRRAAAQSGERLETPGLCS